MRKSENRSCKFFFYTVLFKLNQTEEFYWDTQYSRVLQIRNCVFKLTLLFYNNSLLFYLFFSQKLSVSVSYEVVSYMRYSSVYKYRNLHPCCHVQEFL